MLTENTRLELKNLSHSTTRWRAGRINDASYASLYFLHWQAESHGKRFASRRNRFNSRPDPYAWFEETAMLEAEELVDYFLLYFERYQFLGVTRNVPAALAAWLRGEWALTLCEHIPSSREVLRMQVEGMRPVTVLSAWPRMMAPVLGKPNAFAFMVHDLEHAWKFFHDPILHRQQVELFSLLFEALESGSFGGYLHDPVFSAKFDYLISDMNTHTLHASQFLRAILIEFHLRREGLQHPDGLSRAAREEVSGLMKSLLGAAWLAEVERRMIGSQSLRGAG